MEHLSMSLLGPFRAAIGARALTAFHSDKVRALLAYLAVERDRPHRRESLAGLLWPDYPELSARQSLSQALYDLRAQIGDVGAAPEAPAQGSTVSALLTITRTVVQLNGSACTSDVGAFDALLQACREHGHPAGEGCPVCTQRLERALALYTGDLLAGFTMRDSPEFEEWLAQARERYRRSAVGLAARLATAAGADARGETAIAHARRWVALDPLDEVAHRCLMGLLARAGHRAAALAQYETCRQNLERELGLEPEPATRALWERLRSADLPGASSAAAAPSARLEASRPLHNLPYPVTSFLGRERELANLSRLLGTAGVRLVTLVGAGGMGKTRLALEVARAVLPRYAGGVWLVDLATLTPEAAPETATAHDAADDMAIVRAVAGALRGREVLLLLDNCEHVLGGVASLATLLISRCPELTVLATSREPLHISAEVLYDVAPLSVPEVVAAGAPDEAITTPERALTFGAVRLLVERAAAIRHGYVLTGPDLEPALEVCRLLDGMPLAIELAAAQLHALSLAELAQALGARWRADSAAAAAVGPGGPWQVLGDGNRGALPRQQTVRNTIAWSYDLLARRERLLFGRLSVFAGSFSLDGAESVAGYDGLVPREVGSLLAELVDRSLVVRLGHPGVPRYRMLETLRAYAQERLDERGDPVETIRRHAAHYIGLVEHLEPAVHAQEREALEAYRVLDAEADNLAAAIRRALSDGRCEDALRIGGAAQLWALQRPWFAQYAEWMRAALEGGAEAAPLYSAKGWDYIACWASNWGLTDEMERAARRTIACAKAAGSEHRTGCGLFRLGFALRALGRQDEALDALREAAEIGQKTGDGNMDICCRLALADVGSPAHARAELEALVSSAPLACRPRRLPFGRAGPAGRRRATAPWSRRSPHGCPS